MREEMTCPVSVSRIQKPTEYRGRFPSLFLPILLAFPAVLFFIPFPSPSAQADPAREWHALYVQVRDGTISREDALRGFEALEPRLKDLSGEVSGPAPAGPLTFPLKGYDTACIGGKKGDGYKPGRYDFFDGNRHRGHPSHDLFIRDRDQDGLDDRTGRPVEVVSAAPGIVVSVNSGWEPSSPVRGGNYVWVYAPRQDRYYYYAHLNEIFAAVGRMIPAGEPLGTVGRTGVNAYPRRSPTHLHFTVFRSEAGDPKPVDPYAELVRAARRR
jgi:murein DD-endopeptidase MepM/ murein hydrolase activator NlpD